MRPVSHTFVLILEKFVAGGRSRAMEDEEPLKGFRRRRWQKRQRLDDDLGAN